MRCYLDNDVLHKLSALGLLQQTLAALGVDDLRVLTTATYRFMIGKPDKGHARFGQVVWEQIRDAIASAQPPGEPEKSDIAALAEVLGIDAGEAILFSCAARDPGSLLLTGDKRSLTALTESKTCGGVRDALSGRVLCLEQALQRVIGRVGVAEVVSRVDRSTIADTAIRAVFGPPKTAESIDEGLGSYVKHLRAQTGQLLAP